MLDLYWNIVLICLNNSTHTKIGSITATTIPRWLARISEVICAGLLAIGVAYFVLAYCTLSFSVTAYSCPLFGGSYCKIVENNII